jgi:thioredoxin 1
MIAVGLENFSKEVMFSPEPVVVDFWAGYCPPCRALKPVLEKVSAEGVKVVTVDIEAEPELTEHFNVEMLPTLVVFKNGVAGNRAVGMQSKQDVLDLVKA